MTNMAMAATALPLLMILALTTVTAAAAALVPIVPIAPRAPRSSSSSPSHAHDDHIDTGAMMMSGALPNCYSSQVYNIDNTTGTFGCASTMSNVTIIWNFSTEYTRQLTISYEGQYDATVTVREDNITIYTVPWSTKSAVQITIAAGATTQQLIFYTGQWMPRLQWSMKEVKTPIHRIVSGEPFTLEQQQQGGFVYFTLPWFNFGRLYNVDMTVYAYQGIKNPSVYVGISDLPTLERYDLTNKTTVTIGGDVHCLIHKQKPITGQYYVGVFLYGTTARISVQATWEFNIQGLINGVAVEDTSQSRRTIFYSATVPMGTPQLRFQFSREEPGGYPIARIGQGTPVIADYRWIADTNIQSYWSFIISDPYPSGNASAGVYLVQVTAPEGAGWIIVADW